MDGNDYDYPEDQAESAARELGIGVPPHNPATCWWCQRGLTLVECKQEGSHV